MLHKIKKDVRSQVEILADCQERSIYFKSPYPSTPLIKRDGSTLPINSHALAHGHTGEKASVEVIALTELLLQKSPPSWEGGKEQEHGPDLKFSAFFFSGRKGFTKKITSSLRVHILEYNIRGKKIHQ